MSAAQMPHPFASGEDFTVPQTSVIACCRDAEEEDALLVTSELEERTGDKRLRRCSGGLLAPLGIGTKAEHDVLASEPEHMNAMSAMTCALLERLRRSRSALLAR